MAYLFLVRPMNIARAFAAFVFGVLAGWVVVGCFMIVHDRAAIDGVLWLITLWLPVAVVYSVLIVGPRIGFSRVSRPRCYFCWAASSACFHSAGFGRRFFSDLLFFPCFSAFIWQPSRSLGPRGFSSCG